MRLAGLIRCGILALLLVASGMWGLPAGSATEVPRFSEGLIRATRDPTILLALQWLGRSCGQPSLGIITRYPIYVMFKDMAELGPQLKDYDALAWMSAKGQMVIFVSERHRKAPPQALAALLAHEALHHDRANSVQEEIAGWQQEALVWQQLRGTVAVNQVQGPLVERLSKITAAYEAGRLPEMVRQNPYYRGLPEYSPGFSPLEANSF